MSLGTVEYIINKVEELSGQILKSKEDFKIVVEAALKNKKNSELAELAFQAKFVVGLLGVIKKKDAVVDDDYFIKVSDEFKQAYEKIKKILLSILENESGFVQNIFSEKYFQLSHTSLQNLNLLCEDFAHLKIYLNDLKQKKDSR